MHVCAVRVSSYSIGLDKHKMNGPLENIYYEHVETELRHEPFKDQISYTLKVLMLCGSIDNLFLSGPCPAILLVS
ncbi:hypothetical protein D7027_21020 [Ochrobactrum intermedium]|nr:hypothetical protein [Brucella intermedia]